MPANPIFGGGALGDVNGVTGIPAYGQRDQVLFGGAWLPGDLWQILVGSTSGNLTLGAGNFSTTVNKALTALTPTVCFTYKERVYVGLGSEFAFSENEDPTQWEEQAPGAGSVLYLSQYGGQDQVMGFGQLQGRLAVFAQQTIQLWNTDADPANFANVQTLDNAGTTAPETIQQLGDYDVLYLDRTGFRSLRAKEVTLNAFVDDNIGAPVDDFIQAVSNAGISLAGSCGIVDPMTKNYWCYVNGTIYVLSRSLGGKIQAWSTYVPTDDSGNAFTPQKFIVLNGQVFCRGAEGGLYAYGGLNAAQFDNTVATIVTPYLDDKKPDTKKGMVGIQGVWQGQWTISASCDPKSGSDPAKYHKVYSNAPGPLQPTELIDSTYDGGVIPYEDRGTHFSLMLTSQQANLCVFSAVTLHYNVMEDVA